MLEQTNEQEADSQDDVHLKSQDRYKWALSRSNAHFATPKGADLFDRLELYSEWIAARTELGFWPYARTLETAPQPIASIGYAGKQGRSSINLAVQDYLGLATHPMITEAAERAIRDFGVHSAGSAMLVGNNPLSQKLELSISEFVHAEHVLLFPTGWAAGFGAVTGLVRDTDHIVLDALAHACLQTGSSAATKKLHRYRHLDVDHAEELLRKIRADDRTNAILVIAEGLYSMDSDTPDLVRLQSICSEYNAKLLVDVAHDLGALGEGGRGFLADKQILGNVDIVMGAFSKSFASNGGFIATKDFRVKKYLQWFANPHTFSNALSPIQCAIVETAIGIIRSAEGDQLRSQLMSKSQYFRARLQEHGLDVLGIPSAIVPVLIGREAVARMASRFVDRSGTSTNLVEFPAVGLGAARFRCQLMATHTDSQLATAADDIAKGISEARGEYSKMPQ